MSSYPPSTNARSSDPQSDPEIVQEEDDVKLGDVMELVHMIGRHLKDDQDNQSIARMSAACKAYQADLKTWLEEGKKEYRSVGPESVTRPTAAQWRLVECVDKGCVNGIGDADVCSCLTEKSTIYVDCP